MKGSLAWSQCPTTGTFPDSDKSSPHPHTFVGGAFRPNLNVTSQNSVAFMINKQIFHVFTSLLVAPYSSRPSRSQGSHISSVSNAGLPADWNARM